MSASGFLRSSVPAAVLSRTTMGVIFAGVLFLPLPAEQAEPPNANAQLAKMVGLNRGLCAIVGSDRGLAGHLLLSTELMIHISDRDPAEVAALRRLAESLGLGLKRLVVQQALPNRLPFANNLVDRVILTRSVPGSEIESALSESLRVLRPEGKALVRIEGPQLLEKIRAWAARAGAARLNSARVPGADWVSFFKPAVPGTDDWSHWEHAPDNNPVSSDSVIRAPYMTQFLAEPFYIGMPSITTVAGGRTFLATGHIAHHKREWGMISKLIARNGYNGFVLWKRDLPEGYLSQRSAFIATRDVFYMLEGDHCLMLDARTGVEKGRIRIPRLNGDWKWMAMKDGVLYALAGGPGGKANPVHGDRNLGGWGWSDLSEGYYRRPRVPWGFGRAVAAYHLKEQRLLWKHEEKSLMDSRAMAIQGRRIFLYCPDEHLRCLDTQTGKVLWTNSDRKVLGLIEKPGRGLQSTPGFRSACMALATPEALAIQGQTRMNVVALSAQDGCLLWAKKKFINNPNLIYLDGRIVGGLGERGQTVALDPKTGKIEEDLNFRKAGCTRLTGSPDALFVRGEGLLRYDRASKKIFVDGAARPACSDGALPANGLLYVGPWACDCNLSLIGVLARCPADSSQPGPTLQRRLQIGDGDVRTVVSLEIKPGDWPTYRADWDRSSSTLARLARPNTPPGTPRAPFWTYAPEKPAVPAPPVAAGGLILVAGMDGFIRALDEGTGRLRWKFATAGPVKASPSVWNGRVYVGSGDGFVYALEAATGRLLWKFQAAPAQRLIMVYGNLCSTWPVNTGILVKDRVAYFAAGIIDYDGTYVFAVDAVTGAVKWENLTSGHLNPQLRKGVSAQGCLTVRGGELLMAGGNQVNPARFNLETGECANSVIYQGRPKNNHGKLVGVFLGKYPVAGGRTLYASPENVANKDSFVVLNGRGAPTLNFGGIPPSWNEDAVALVNFRDGKLACFNAAKVAARVEKGFPPPSRPGQRRHWYALAQAFQQDGALRWLSDLGQPNKFEVVSLVMCPSAVVVAVRYQPRHRARPQWFLVALNAKDGTPYWFWNYTLPSKPLPEGLLVGSRGQVLVTMLDGTIRSYGPRQPNPPPAPPKQKKKP